MFLVSSGWVLNCTYSFTIACLLAFNDIGCSSIVGIYNASGSKISESSFFCKAGPEDEYYISCTVSPVSFALLLCVCVQVQLIHNFNCSFL